MRLEHEYYEVANPEEVVSPGLVVFMDLVRRNLAEVVRMAGGPERLRPHCKTHKMPRILQEMTELGITKHKCATLAEAEMLAHAGVTDVLIAYQLVGPNIRRLGNLMDRFPAVKFAVVCDAVGPLEALSDEMAARGREVGVLLDVDSGMGRTGVRCDGNADELYEAICSSPGIRPAGLHWYDGHTRQTDPAERQAAVLGAWQPLLELRDRLLVNGFPVPAIVAGGTGSFGILAETGEPNLEVSPGTTTFFDLHYGETFSDLNFLPAAGVLTRVVSANRPGHVTLDCGHKSIAPDQPAGRRMAFPSIPDAVEVAHTEEHLVIATSIADQLAQGDALVALPRHVCSTVALHCQAALVEGGRVIEHYAVESRDRV